MVATVRALKSSAAAVSYYEKDGYYAKDDPEHRDASFWHGGAAKDLGLKGHVLPGEFEDVLAGWVPGTEIRLGRMREGEHDHRPGLDITLSAPKSVSLEALVVGDRRVIRAHDDAVRATLDWIETDLLQTRGFDPMTRQRPRVAAHGMAVAGFRHLTSRIGEGTPRRRFVDAVKAYGERYREAVRKGFRKRLGEGVPGLEFAFER